MVAVAAGMVMARVVVRRHHQLSITRIMECQQ